MPNETTLKNSIKIFSSKYMADLACDLGSSYVLNFNFMTTFRSELKKVFERNEPMILKEPVEEISGDFSIILSGLKPVLACLSRSDTAEFAMMEHEELNEFHIVANCYDPMSNNVFIGYYCGLCRLTEAPYSDFSDVTAGIGGGSAIKFSFKSGFLKTALGAFDAYNVAGTNSANQQIPFNNTPLLFEGKYAVSVYMDDTVLVKGTDYTEDAEKVTVINPVPVTSKVTIVYIYNP